MTDGVGPSPDMRADDYLLRMHGPRPDDAQEALVWDSIRAGWLDAYHRAIQIVTLAKLVQRAVLVNGKFELRDDAACTKRRMLDHLGASHERASPSPGRR